MVATALPLTMPQVVAVPVAEVIIAGGCVMVTQVVALQEMLSVTVAQ